ncbi:MAG: hypothetical protein Kow00121_15360 [Elainellaceae cyanobacterium]
MSRSIPQVNSDKPLGGRYKVINQLGVGGFGRTFLAEDLHLPGHPQCVVKQLKPQFRSDDTLQMARRCFNTEAQVLYRLGNHEQIPRLLAHFEDNQEFYLAQEFIAGVPLTKELAEGKPWSEAKAVELLKDILQVLAFVHEQQVIHRDLKPSNLIRRQSDGKIVLIDFGAVKQVSAQNYDQDTGLTNLTISIGTQGYMPNEQLAGKPRFSSDIYAVGMLGIQALTGIHPKHLGDDEKGEIAWQQRAPHVNPELVDVISKMVRYDFRDRYVTAAQAFAALENLPAVSSETPPTFKPFPDAVEAEIPEMDTAPSSELHQSVSQNQRFSAPGAEFSSVDLTLAGEEGISTAIWSQPEPESTATLTHKTGATQAIGGSHPAASGAEPPSKHRKWLPLINPLVIVAVLATAALGAVAVQTVAPDFFSQFTSPSNDPSTPVAPSPSPSPSPPTLGSTDIEAVFAYANQLKQKQEYETALQYYDRAIALKPDYAEAYAARCEVLNQLNRPEEAIVSCNDALAYKPDLVEASWSRGNALMLQGRTYEALKIYEDVTYVRDDFAPGWVKRGVALQTLGRSAEAVYMLDEAIRLERNSAEAWSTRGAALLILQRYDEALVALDKALQLQNPDDPETLNLRQQVRDQLGR